MSDIIKKKKWVGKVNIAFLFLIFLSLPFSLNINAIILGFYVFFGMLFLERRKVSKNELIAGIGLGLFLWLSIMWLRTASKKDIDFIIRLLPLGILPFLFAWRKVNVGIRWLTVVLTVSSACAIVAGICRAIMFYNSPDQHFSWLHLPHTLQGGYYAVYFAIQLGINILLLMYCYKTSRNIAYLVAGSLFFIFMILLGKRMALLSLLLVITLWGLINFSFKRIIVGGMIIGAISILFFLLPYNRWRIDNLSHEGEASERIVMTSSSVSVIKQNMVLGVGANKVSESLNAEYTRRGIKTPFFSNNPHNQYLYILMGYGIVGFLIFSGLYIFICKEAWAAENRIFFYSFAFFTLVSFTETILIRQQGIVLYSFLLSFLFYNREYGL